MQHQLKTQKIPDIPTLPMSAINTLQEHQISDRFEVLKVSKPLIVPFLLEKPKKQHPSQNSF